MSFQPFLKEGKPGAFVVRDTRSDVIVFEHKWSNPAVQEAARLNVEAGACPECKGEGSIIVDWYATPDGGAPMGADCSSCGGAGVIPTDRIGHNPA